MMICSRCTTELPAMATVCPQCGSGVARGQSAPFSYLPSGAPPWPIRPLESFSSIAESKAGKPFVGEVRHIKVRRRPHIWVRRVVSVVLALVITPILGILATLGILALQGQFAPHPHKSLSHFPNSVSSTSTLPPPSVFKPTSNGMMNISLQYPVDWNVETPDQLGDPVELPITQPERLVRLDIARFSTSLSSQFAGPDELNSRVIGQVSQQFTSVKLAKAPNTQPTIGNDQWMEQDVTYLDQNNTEIHFTTITVLHNHQNYYNINFSMPEKLYQQAMQQYIQPMLDSFKFLA